jgi:uncharacterized membrane protein
MSQESHLWAIAYDNVDRADDVRKEIEKIGWDERSLSLVDIAVVVRHADGSFTFNQEPFPPLYSVVGCTAVGFLAGLIMAAPLAGAAVGAVMGGLGSVATSSVGIQDDFVRDVESLMKPSTSVLFVLDDEGNMEAILHGIRGLGGTVFKTNVDVERAKLIQSTLAAAAATTNEAGKR